jgi:hypothetical protein
MCRALQERANQSLSIFVNRSLPPSNGATGNIFHYAKQLSTSGKRVYAARAAFHWSRFIEHAVPSSV